MSVQLSNYSQLVYDIIGASMVVHSTLSWGLLEPVYQESLQLELRERGIESEREVPIKIYYKNHLLDKQYKMDLVVGDIIVEMKSVSKLTAAHRAQLCNYLRLTRKPLGLLINFGDSYLIGERWAYDKDTNCCYLVDREMNPVPRETSDNLLIISQTDEEQQFEKNNINDN